jgi:hypothetical protein
VKWATVDTTIAQANVSLDRRFRVSFAFMVVIG